MTFLTVLYTLIIYPIELLFEIVFSVIFKQSGNVVISIIILSLVFNLVVLPLYRRADSIQEEAREKEIKLAPVIKHIKESFKGDERFMILQTYYRQNDYSPMNVLKSSVSLLLQIPFFIAAYRMLSGCNILTGAAAGPIKDLSQPDGLLVIGGLAINILPIVMTLVNIISGVIYGKGLPLKSKMQMYLIAAVFLVFLYNSPSGLVFYWTLNNVFSLVKNIIMVASRGKKAKEASSKKPAEKPDRAAAMRSNILFSASAAFLAIFTGFFIPTNVISASPQQFMNRYTMSDPALYLFYPLLTGAGLFLIWCGLFYYLASPKGRSLMSKIMFIMCSGALLNNAMYSNRFGDMVETLQYINGAYFDTESKIWDAVFLLFALCVCILLLKYTKSLPTILAGCGAVALIIISFGNISKINQQYKLAFNGYSEEAATFTLSKEGNNVVVLMLDRAIGTMVPYIMNEQPQLKESFDGFTWYRNTLSYGMSTNFASPALYGGYEYTPEKINERSNESLADKQNEALKVMPTVFTKEGWDCTFINPTYAGYSWIPDLTVFKDFKGLKAYNTGYHYLPDLEQKCTNLENTLCRNLFCYSLFKSSPVAIQQYIYDGGKYNMTNGSLTGEASSSFQVVDGTSLAIGHYLSFEAEYYALKSIDKMTKISDSGNNLVIFANKSTHDMSMLSEPEYEPKYYVNNIEYDKTHTDRFILDGKQLKMENTSQYVFYEMNTAALLSIGKWLDYLKAQGVYDNTRIIIVSDHAYSVGQYDELMFNNDGQDFDAQGFLPILMVKDFGSHGWKVSDEFMTNADTPAIATNGLIKNAVNPFSGNPLNAPEKKKGPQKVIFSGTWDVLQNGTNTFEKSQWYSVKDNVWDRSNWKYEGVG